MTPDTTHSGKASRQTERCGTTTGPSAEEWEAQKPTIIRLYHQMQWSQLDEIMRNEHGFHASKRMYNQRFRQWNVSKYLKISDKTGLLKECGGSIKELTARMKAGKIKKGEYNKTLRWYRSTQPTFPTRAISVNPKIVNTEVILRSLRDYHFSLVEPNANTVLDSRFLDLETSHESENLWFGIIRGVKDLAAANARAELEAARSGESAAKTQAITTTETTFAMLRQVGSLAAPAMLKRPLDFICELLVEITAFRTKEWPSIRNVILRLFNQEASRVFWPSHPIAVICREMLKEGVSPEVANRSMDCMKDLSLQLWGEESILTFKNRKAIYTALLKARNIEKAERVGLELLLSSQKIWGPHSKQARMACFRLGQLYLVKNELAMARGGVDRAAIGNALHNYFGAITRPSSDVQPISPTRVMEYYEDETTLGAMADIAFIHNRTGNDAEALAWYQKTAEMSRRLCGLQSNVTKAAIGELISKLREMGRLEQVLAWEGIMSQQTESIT